MPKQNKQKKMQRRRRKVAASRGIPRNLQIVPPAFSKIHPAYVSVGTLTEAAAGVGAYYSYRMNSIYDPDFSGVGTSAIGYTDLSSMYGLFRVLRVRAIARFFLTTTGVATVGLIAGLNSTYSGVIATWQAQPNSFTKLIQGVVGGAHAVAEFDMVFDLAKIAGVTQQQFRTDFDFSHTVGANPVKSLYLSAFGVGSSAAAQSVGYTLRLVYEVEASQPSQSLTS